MSTLSDQPLVTRAEQAPEPTLASLATRFVRTTVPRNLYRLLHLALPFAIDLGMRGWWRGAGWLLAVAAFGAWGLADRWLADHGSDDSPWERPVRTVRGLGGVLAIVPTVVLLLDAFLRLLGNAPIS